MPRRSRVDFRGAKLRTPVAGDLVWSVPTRVTLSRGAYETDTFLPPHAGTP